MRRSSKGISFRLSADSQRLITLCKAIVQAGSRLEQRAWERELDLLLQKILKHGHQNDIDAALENLFKGKSEAYAALLEAIEAASESCAIEHDGKTYDALLVAVPILAWTRFAIASGPISQDMLMTLTAHLYAHVLAPDTRMALSPVLYAIDQLPKSHVDTFDMTQRLAQAALSSGSPRTSASLPETAPFLADTRYLLAAVVAPAGSLLFRWQASANPADKEVALAQWQAQARPNIERLLPGCGIELLLPDAYFMACREADKKIRPASIRAAVHYLTHTLNVTPEEIFTVIGGFGEAATDARIDEYRISFVAGQHSEVVYGLVWPLYDEEEALEELPGFATSGADAIPVAPLQEITALLKESGIVHIKRHEEFFPMEFCDDCDAPLYCDLDGELVHAEMPEEAVQTPSHLH